MADIFLNYARQNTQSADLLISLLEKEGFSVWVDRTRIYGADIWLEDIAKAIDECSIILALLSSASAERPMVQQEIIYAFEQGKKILPVYLEQVELPHALRIPFAGIQHVEYKDIQGIFNALRRTLRPIPIKMEERLIPPYSQTIKNPASEFGRGFSLGNNDRYSGNRDQKMLESYNSKDKSIRCKSRGYINAFYRPIFNEDETEEFFEIDIQGADTSAAIIKTRPDRIQIVYVVATFVPDTGSSINILDGSGKFHFYSFPTLPNGAYGNGFKIESNKFYGSSNIDIHLTAQGLEDACIKFFSRYEISAWRILPKEFYDFVFHNG
jgi:hypothetical protein